ncbi:MAG: hypothetical protein PHR16_00080 [Methylovulum sp.]|nr:hypothetical protein [Methylovulum sp.]
MKYSIYAKIIPTNVAIIRHAALNMIRQNPKKRISAQGYCLERPAVTRSFGADILMKWLWAKRGLLRQCI